MLQWFIRSPQFAEFTEFTESSTAFKKNSNVLLHPRYIDLMWSALPDTMHKWHEVSNITYGIFIFMILAI